MKTTTATAIAAVLSQAVPAYAAGEPAGGHLLISAFLGFAALIVVFQLVPALMMFAGMLKGLFQGITEAPETELEAKPRK